MARKAREGTNEFSNFDPELVRDLISRLDEFSGELESERGSYMKRCRDIRESITGVYTEATARGVPGGALKKFMKTRKQLAKARELIADLAKNERKNVKLIAEAFGDAADLPLFNAAIKAAGGIKGGADDPAPEPEPEATADAEVDNGAERLAGMKKPRGSRRRKTESATEDAAPPDAVLN